MDRKERYGDLEADTIIGKKHKGIIVTINDRMTGMLKIKKVSGKKVTPVAEAIIHLPEVCSLCRRATLWAVKPGANGEIVDRKERYGDQGADAIIGKKHKGIIGTINDRMTGMLKMKKVSSKKATPVAEAIIHLPVF